MTRHPFPPVSPELARALADWRVFVSLPAAFFGSLGEWPCGAWLHAGRYPTGEPLWQRLRGASYWPERKA
jgi:hypothetical protein